MRILPKKSSGYKWLGIGRVELPSLDFCSEGARGDKQEQKAKVLPLN
jgi:hypothetical protein